jgi:hypothetical protein
VSIRTWEGRGRESAWRRGEEGKGGEEEGEREEVVSYQEANRSPLFSLLLDVRPSGDICFSFS